MQPAAMHNTSYRYSSAGL